MSDSFTADASQSRAYEATSTGRRLGSWGTRNPSPSEAVSQQHHLLVSRSRHMVRNNPWIQRAIKVDLSREIGKGIKPRPNTPFKDFNAELVELWKDWAKHACIDGGGIYKLQRDVSRAKKISGECFVIIVRPRSNSQLPVPLQFRVLESEYCPIGENSTATPLQGNEVIDGIEYNPKGAKVAYHLYKKHPNEFRTRGHGFIGEVSRHPVSNVIHYFEDVRPSQRRGEPKGVQGFVKAQVYDKYTDAELVRKDIRSQFTGVIERPDFGVDDYNYDPITGNPLSFDKSDVPILDLEAGTFPNLLAGEKLNLFDGDSSGTGYHEFQKWQMMAISSAYNVPYQLITGDYTGLNDRLWRAIINQYKREVEQEQELMMSLLCDVVWNNFVNRALFSGAVSLPSGANAFNIHRVKHVCHAWEFIHPVQDVQASILQVDNGFTSRKSVIDAIGSETIESVDTDNNEDNFQTKEQEAQSNAT